MNVVLFELAGGWHALPGEAVLEVIPPLPTTPLPFSPACVDGLINHAGQVLLQVDLAVRLGLAERPVEGMLLIVRGGGFPCALHIQRVVAMMAVAETTIHWCQTGPGEGPVVLGELEWQGKTVLLWDADHLMPAGLVPPPVGEATAHGLLGRAEEAGLATRESAEEALHGLVVESLGCRYALRLADVQEVVEVTSLTPMPHAPAEVAGVVSLRHQPYLAVTLAGLLQLREPEAAMVMILVEVQGMPLGLLVKRVVGMARFDSRHRHPTDGQAAYQALLQDQDQRMIAQLNLHGLIDDQRLARYRPFMPRSHGTVEQQERNRETRAFLSVRVGEEWCAIPLEAVDRVVEYEPPDPLTRAEADRMDGVAQIHGEITPVSDLHRWFGSPRQARVPGAYVVVRVADRPWALVVDQVNRVVNIPVRDIEPLADQRRSWITGVGQIGGRLFSLLHVAAVAG